MKKKVLWMASLACICMLTACDSSSESKIHNRRDIPYVPKTTEAPSETEGMKYDVRDRMMVEVVDAEEQRITMCSMQDGERITFTYTGGTDITDKYGDVLSASVLPVGELVDAYYLNNGNQLVKLQVSDEAFRFTDLRNFEYNEQKQFFTIKGEKYSYDDNLAVWSDGKQIMLSQIEDMDHLTVRGFDRKVCSIEVTKGHGYLQLDKTDFFEGGIIEIGKYSVHLIEKNMLITVPEGTYNITATIDGTGGVKEITVHREEEVKLSLTELQGEAIRYGSINFEILPEDAVLTVDGVTKSYEELVELSYGKHHITVTAEGYDSYSGFIVVNSVFESLNIDLTGETVSEGEDTTEG